MSDIQKARAALVRATMDWFQVDREARAQRAKERDDARQARAAASLKAKREARLAQRKAMLDEAGATLRVIAPDGAAVPVATLAAHLKRSVASVRATVRLAARAGLVSLDGDLVRMCDATP